MAEKYPSIVAYHFLNIDGELMCMEESGKSTEKFLKEGFTIDGSSIKGMSSVEKSDLKVIPEKDSYLHIKIGDFEHDRFMAHFVNEHGQPHPKDPRSIFQNQIDKARNMGFEPHMFSEIEFYIVDKLTGKPVDQASYCSLPPFDVSYDFRHELDQVCNYCKMNVKRIHHECGPGQNEIELNFSPCMKNADDSVLCKWILQMLADKRGQKIIFTPKPFEHEAGSGLHHHILLKDLKTNENIFYNKDFKGDLNNPEENKNKLSEYCYQFIEGLLVYADDITAVFASCQESFDRLRPGYEAPIFKSWDFQNRTALVRVPKTPLEMSRMEYRGGDLSGSVHLYGCVLLAAGLKGIEKKMKCRPNANYNVEKLSYEQRKALGIDNVPGTFAQTMKILKESEFLKECLGQEMVDYLYHRAERLHSTQVCQHCHPPKIHQE